MRRQLILFFISLAIAADLGWLIVLVIAGYVTDQVSMDRLGRLFAASFIGLGVLIVLFVIAQAWVLVPKRPTPKPVVGKLRATLTPTGEKIPRFQDRMYPPEKPVYINPPDRKPTTQVQLLKEVTNKINKI